MENNLQAILEGILDTDSSCFTGMDIHPLKAGGTGIEVLYKIEEYTVSLNVVNAPGPIEMIDDLFYFPNGAGTHDEFRLDIFQKRKVIEFFETNTAFMVALARYRAYCEWLTLENGGRLPFYSIYPSPANMAHEAITTWVAPDKKKR